MGRSRYTYLSYSAFVLLSAASTASAGSVWDVSIDESPAPLPQDGPPFSAHASRNPALLPFQIVGIVGAYIASCLIVGSLLLTVGRGLRKQAQTMAAQPKEMVKPMRKAFDPSPVSPGSSRSWYSPRRLRNKKSAASSVRSGASNQLSPGMDSVVSFDTNVIEADRVRRQGEMERLYAAVMAQDERKASQQNVARGEGTAPPEYSRKNPPHILTDDPSLRHLQTQGSGPVSPSTPKSPVRAIYPPGSSIPAGPASPTSPIKADYTNYSLPQQGSSGSDLKVGRERRTPSFGSERTIGDEVPYTSTAGTTKKIRKSLRNIKISAPLMKDDNSDGARTPLSPRTYTDPGIPPEPPTSRTTGTNGTMDSAGYPPTTPGTGRSWRYGEEPDSDEEQLDEVRDLPRPNPQRQSSYKYENQAQMVTDAASTRPDPTKPTPGGAGGNSLPFREMNRAYAAQQQNQPPQAQSAFPLSPGQWNNNPHLQQPTSAGGTYMTSAGPVKTTFLEARRDLAKVGGTPRTGMATPYSPYMPYTPLTPVTPHLTSRAERKQRKREEKAVGGAIAEEDAVVDEAELWSSGY